MIYDGSLISKPIISGYEDGYLMTQALAEYIAYVYPENIDGLLFKSTQHDKGSNIVIFSKKITGGEIIRKVFQYFLLNL